jgi:DNA polymerase V
MLENTTVSHPLKRSGLACAWNPIMKEVWIMPVVALADCNNFFVSCERAVDPTLENRPVVVLSNNDGCVISRSNEAKAMGIRMGEPYFKLKSRMNMAHVRVISSNFNLYTAKSAQVMAVLAKFSPQLEHYSVDEAFLTLNEVPKPLLRACAMDIRQAVFRETGIPVSLGIAETKTLAKLANAIAKKSARFGGVSNLFQSPHWDMVLSRTPVGEVWGVGRRLSNSLSASGIATGQVLRDADDRWILRRFNVTLLRTVLELRGTPCFPLETGHGGLRQSVMYTRSFGQLITRLEQLESAVASFAAHAAEKLREERVAAQGLTVYFRTSRHIDEDSRFSACGEVRLPAPTDCTQDLIHAALSVTREIFCAGYSYYKAGILLTGLVPASEKQMSLFETRDLGKLDTLMHTLDVINRTHGAGTLQFAAEGTHKPWLSRKEGLSPAGLAACESGALLPVTGEGTVVYRPKVGFVHPRLG